MTDDTDEPTVVYVPGAENHYDICSNTVVLDALLKEHSTAHEVIKSHELEHARQTTSEGWLLPAFLRYELTTDLRRGFDYSEEQEAVREYYEARDDAYGAPIRTRLSTGVGNVARSLWLLPILAIGGWYQLLRDLREVWP